VSVADEHARISEDDDVIIVTLSRPEKLNPISPAVTATLWEATEALASRPELRSMIITGEGRYFSAGLDLKEGHGGRLPGKEALGREWRRGYRSHHLLYDELESIEKPVIIAANGSVFGGALEMACSCDFRFCTPEADFALPEIALGSIPGSGGVSRLTRLVGTHWAKWLAMGNQRIDAERALAIGLVHEIVPADALMTRARDFARQLSNLDPETVALAKLTIDLSDPQDREKVRHVERIANTQLVHLGTGKVASGHRLPSAASDTYRDRQGGA
jgi:enoyl-CoA hydratase/carnithine racemase